MKRWHLLIVFPVLGIEHMLINAVMWYPCNHGPAATAYIDWFLLWLAVAAICWAVSRSRANALAAMAAILGIALVILFDRCNVMVQYDVWIARGMPKCGELHHGLVSGAAEEGPSACWLDELFWAYDRDKPSYGTWVEFGMRRLRLALP